MTWPVVFKIRPDRRGTWRLKGGWFDVVVYKDLRALRRAHPERMRDAVAMTYTKSQPREETRHLGTLYFARSHCGAGVTAHECAHAAMRFLSWQATGYTFERKFRLAEEAMALATGNLMRELTMALIKHCGRD